MKAEAGARRSRRRAAPLLALFLAACPGGGGPAPSGSAWLEDATAASGLSCVHDVGEARGHYFPEIMGSGVALFDADGDGDLDVYLVNAGPDPVLAPGAPGEPDRLFANQGGARFVDVTEASGTGDRGYGMGATAADVDGDGALDLLVTNVGPDVLYRGHGDGRFEDASAAAGLGEDGWSTSALFADLDRDGDLDLYVARYVELDPARACRDAAGRADYCGPKDFPPAADRLYENDGRGHFREVGQELGLRADPRRGLGVLACDLAGDGALEVYVANDDDPDQLWVRGADGRVHDEALRRGLAYSGAGEEQAGMGVLCADVDGDGDLDVLLSNLRGQTDTAYVRGADGAFGDGSAQLGLVAATTPVTGFGLVAADLDGDGAPDLVQVNGHVSRPPRPEPGGEGPLAEYAERPLLLRGTGAGFVQGELEAGAFGRAGAVGRGLALGDLDGDGLPDLVATSAAGPARVLLDRAPGAAGRVLRVVAREADGRPALGATVLLVVGGVEHAAWIPAGGSYLSCGEPAAWVGLGAAAIGEARVRWPDGSEERFAGVGARGTLVLVHGSGR